MTTNLELLTQHKFLQYIGDQAAQQEYVAYLVGGVVRDSHMHKLSGLDVDADVDIVFDCTQASGDACKGVIALAHDLQGRYGGRLTTHQSFRTATWSLDGATQATLATELDLPVHELPDSIDLITAREEWYPEPASLPTIQPSHIQDDLARRDFTINTLALSLHPDYRGQLLEYHNGLADLEAGLIRTLHDNSFIDDPTRIFRAVRYEQRFNFQLETETLQQLKSALERLMLDHLTPARMRHEFERIFGEEQPEKSLRRLAELDSLASIDPNLAVDEQTVEEFTHLRAQLLEPSAFRASLLGLPISYLYWATWVYHFDSHTRSALQTRLIWPKEGQRLADGLASLYQSKESLSQPDLRPSQIVDLLERIDDGVYSLAALLWSDNALLIDRFTNYLHNWQHVRSHLRGNDLRDLGIPSGPIYAQILRDLRNARLDGELTSREDELAWVQALDS